MLGVVAVLDEAADLIKLELDGHRLLEGAHQVPVFVGLVAIGNFCRPVELSMSGWIGWRFRLLSAPMLNDFAILEPKEVEHDQRSKLALQAFVLRMQKNEIAVLERAIDSDLRAR